jgi:ribose/xylose/arabinose/galactoside ABC-type transport system permease subunit
MLTDGIDLSVVATANLAEIAACLVRLTSFGYTAVGLALSILPRLAV